MLRHSKTQLLFLLVPVLLAQSARADVAYVWGDPQPVPGLPSNVSSIASGGLHGLALANGTLYAWGDNYLGELGNGHLNNADPILIPAPVIGMTSGVTATAAGAYFSFAIQNGALYAWGDDFYGQLGNNTTKNYYSSIPVPVAGLSSGVTAIAAGWGHSLAIQNGALVAWGDNSLGQLGTSLPGGNTPAPVVGLSSGITAIAAGTSYGLAIQNARVFAWGSNQWGQLGNGTNDDASTPVPVTGLTSTTAIAAGAEHGLALQDGLVYAWGSNMMGQLGNPNSASWGNTPQPVQGLSNIVDIAASAYDSFALDADGSLWVWGFNSNGELGDGSTSPIITPKRLPPPAGYRITSLAANATGRSLLTTLAPAPEPATLLFLALLVPSLLIRRTPHVAESNA